ncbi:MAG: putative bifunctional diguanylate cyclase/phosphodiesterase [Gammaproteobacteria bacterium]
MSQPPFPMRSGRPIARAAMLAIGAVNNEALAAGSRVAPPMTFTLASLLLAATVVSLLLAAIALYAWYRLRLRSRRAQQEFEQARTALLQHLDHLGEYSNDAILLLDDQDRIIDANKKALEIYGYSRAEMLRRSIADLRTLEALANYKSQWVRARQQHGVLFETVHQNRDGVTFPVEVSARVIAVHGRRFRQAIIRNIVDRKQAEADVARARDFYLALLDGFPNPMWRAGADAKCDYFNQAWLDFTGRSLAEELGNGWTQSIHADDLDHCVTTYLEAFRARRAFSLEYRLRHHDGNYRWVADHGNPLFDLQGTFAGYIGSVHDIQQIKSAEERMEFLAHHDPLTQLPNRMLLHDRIERALARARRDGHEAAVLFIDLDRFKTVNDSLGHVVGDQLLRLFADRLRSCVRDADTVGRVGGDEFVVVIPDLREINAAVPIAQKILDAMASDFQLGEHRIQITPSIGISAFPQDGQDAQTLISNADAAMYTAKENGRNNIQFFSPALYLSAHERISLEYGMRHAVERGEFELFYQPQIDFATRAVIGVEALLRWHHPGKGLLLPASFLTVAEDSGLILPIGRWTLSTACRQCREWQASGIADVPVCVNLSPLQFRHRELLREVESVLAETGLPAGQLHLSITEAMLAQPNGDAESILGALNAIGVHVTIDDLSTRHPVPDKLQHGAVHTLMLSRKYVRNITQDSEDAAIACAIIGLAHKLKLKVIAEGVETIAQFNLLRDESCDAAQGYYFSEPLPARHIGDLLRSGLIGAPSALH